MNAIKQVQKGHKWCFPGNGIVKFNLVLQIVFIKKENGFRYRLAGKSSVRHIQAQMEEGLNAKGGGRDTDISGQLPANRKEIESFLIKTGFTEEQ